MGYAGGRGRAAGGGAGEGRAEAAHVQLRCETGRQRCAPPPDTRPSGWGESSPQMPTGASARAWA